MKKKTYLLIALAMVSMGMNAQNSEKSSLGNDAPEFVKTMKIGGTIRSKYEYQTEEGEGRFEVRTARINVCCRSHRREPCWCWQFPCHP